MNIRYFISERLKTIRSFYRAASEPLLENMQKIESQEAPYDELPDGFDPEMGEPPYLEEWQLHHDALTLLGHSTIAMLQVALKLYLDSYKKEVDRFYGKQKWKPEDDKSLRGSNWFPRNRTVFLEVLGGSSQDGASRTL